MPRNDEIQRCIEELSDFRTRGQARRRLQAYGEEAAAQLLDVIADGSRPENVRWAAITVVESCQYEPACEVLLEVMKTDTGLRGTAIHALESIADLRIGDDPQTWEKALADPEAFRNAQEKQAETMREESPEEEGYELFRKALADEATEFNWEDEGYLYLRIPLEAGRKQQLVVTFNETDPSGQALATIYTECGEPTPGIEESIARRNVTLKYGKFLVEHVPEGAGKVVMRESIPAHRLDEELVRDVVLAMATEADSLELELTGTDHI